MNSYFSKFVSFLKQYNKQLISVGFSIIGLYLRYQMLAKRELWLDEKHQLKYILGPLKHFWKRLSPLETFCEVTAFPGDYVLTYPFVQIFGSNKWGINIPHILGTIIGFYLLYLICQKYLKTAAAYVITFALFSFNHELIFHAFEFRWYSVLPVLSLAVFYLSEMVICRGDQLSGLKKFFIGFFFALVVGYHACGILIVFFCMMFFILLELSRQSLREVILKVWKFCCLLSVVVIPLFLWYSTDLTKSMGESHLIATFEYIPNPLVDALGFFKSVFGNLLGRKQLYVLFLGLILSVLLPHKDRLKQIGFFLLMVIIPIQVILLGDLSKSFWFIQRQFIWVTPFFLLLLGWCWDSVILWSKEQIKVRFKK